MYPAIFGLEAIIRKGLTKGRGLYIYIYIDFNERGLHFSEN